MGRFFKRMLREILAATGNTGSNQYVIVYVDGFQEPEVVVERKSYYYTTPGGKPVYYPSAYRRAFGKPVYHSATQGTIRVGKGWAIQHAM